MSTVSRTRRSRKPLTPATGSVRWAVQPSMNGEPGVLVITAKRSNGQLVSEAYTVSENRDRGQLVGYRLEKPDGVVYDLTANLMDCSCPDFVCNRANAETEDLRKCKHCRGLKVALIKLGN